MKKVKLRWGGKFPRSPFLASRLTFGQSGCDYYYVYPFKMDEQQRPKFAQRFFPSMHEDLIKMSRFARRTGGDFGSLSVGSIVCWRRKRKWASVPQNQPTNHQLAHLIHLADREQKRAFYSRRQSENANLVLTVIKKNELGAFWASFLRLYSNRKPVKLKLKLRGIRLSQTPLLTQKSSLRFDLFKRNVRRQNVSLSFAHFRENLLLKSHFNSRKYSNEKKTFSKRGFSFVAIMTHFCICRQY